MTFGIIVSSISIHGPFGTIIHLKSLLRATTVAAYDDRQFQLRRIRLAFLFLSDRLFLGGLWSSVAQRPGQYGRSSQRALQGFSLRGRRLFSDRGPGAVACADDEQGHLCLPNQRALVVAHRWD